MEDASVYSEKTPLSEEEHSLLRRPGLTDFIYLLSISTLCYVWVAIFSVCSPFAEVFFFFFLQNQSPPRVFLTLTSQNNPPMVFQILKSQLRLRHLYTEQKTYIQLKLP